MKGIYQHMVLLINTESEYQQFVKGKEVEVLFNVKLSRGLYLFIEDYCAKFSKEGVCLRS